MNKTNAHWHAVESDLQQTLEKKKTLWDNLPWEVIAILVAIVVGTTGLVLAAKKVWDSWTSTFNPPTTHSTFRMYYDTSPTHNTSPQVGMATIEDVREQGQALLSQPILAPPQMKLAAIEDRSRQGQLHLQHVPSPQQRLVPFPQISLQQQGQQLLPEMTTTWVKFLSPAGEPINSTQVTNIVSEI